MYAHPASTQHGNTAMMLAAEKNRYLVIEALLAAHADPRAKNYARARHANRYRPHTARPPNVCTLRPWQCRLSPINAIPAPRPNPLPKPEPYPGPDPNAAVREDSVGHGARQRECRRCEAVAGGGRWWTGAARAARGDSATGWGGGCGTELARGLMAASGPTP